MSKNELHLPNATIVINGKSIPVYAEFDEPPHSNDHPDREFVRVKLHVPPDSPIPLTFWRDIFPESHDAV